MFLGAEPGLAVIPQVSDTVVAAHSSLLEVVYSVLKLTFLLGIDITLIPDLYELGLSLLDENEIFRLMVVDQNKWLITLLGISLITWLSMNTLVVEWGQLDDLWKLQVHHPVDLSLSQVGGDTHCRNRFGRLSKNSG